MVEAQSNPTTDQVQPPANVSEQSITQYFGLKPNEVVSLKEEIRKLYDKHDLDRLKDMKKPEARNERWDILTEAISENKITGKVAQRWSEKFAKESLYFLLRNIQHKKARRQREVSQMPKSLQTGRPETAPSSIKPPVEVQRCSVEPACQARLSLRVSDLLHFPPPPPPTQEDRGAQTTNPASFQPPARIPSYMQHKVRSFWLCDTDTKPRTPSAAELYRVFLITESATSNISFRVMVSDLPSHGINGDLSQEDWNAWLQLLRKYFGFDPREHQIWASGGRVIISDCFTWRTAIMLRLEEIGLNGFDNVTGPLSVTFSIEQRKQYGGRETIAATVELGDSYKGAKRKLDTGPESPIQNQESKRIRHISPDPGETIEEDDGSSIDGNEARGSASPSPSTARVQGEASGRLSPVQHETSHEQHILSPSAPASICPCEATPQSPSQPTQSVEVRSPSTPTRSRESAPQSPLIPTRSAEGVRTKTIPAMENRPSSREQTPDWMLQFNKEHGLEDVIADIITRETINSQDDIEQSKEEAEMDMTSRIHVATKKCEQFSLLMWGKFQKFFMLPRDGVNGTNPHIPIPFVGLDRSPLPAQLYANFIQLHKERGVGEGGFLGDVMGLGKTMTSFMLIFLNGWLAQNELSVKQFRSNPNASRFPHLPADAPAGASCPSQNQWPFLCRCVNSPFSASQFETRRGATMIIVPKSLLLSWAQQYKVTVPTDRGSTKNLLKFRLLIGHGDIGTKVIDELDHPYIDVLEDNQSRIQATEDLMWGSRDFRYIVLTTPQSFERRVLPFTDTIDPNSKVDFFRDSGILARLRWGMLVRDEFHLEKGKDSKTVRVFKQLTRRQDGRPLPIWLLSGTIFDRGPIDILHWLGVLETEMWEDHPVLCQATDENYKVLSARVNRLLTRQGAPTPQEMQELESLACTFSSILEELAICRSAESTWFSKPIIKLPPNKHKDIRCKIPSQYLEQMNQQETLAMDRTQKAFWNSLTRWQTQKNVPKPTVSLGKFFAYSHVSRFASVFPAILPIIEEYKLALTEDEYKTKKWNTTDNLPPYFERMDELVKSSSKCTTVKWILQEMAESTDFAGRPEKVIIVSSLTIVIRILARWLAQEGYSVAPVYGKLNAEQRMEIVEVFNNDWPLRKPESDNPNTPTIILGTPAIIGTGYTLTRARRTILMGPEWLATDEEQVAARTRRIGQQNDFTYTYRLVGQGVKVEEGILNRQKLRKEFDKIALELQEEGSSGNPIVA